MHPQNFIPTGFKTAVTIPPLPQARKLTLDSVSVLSSRIASLYLRHREEVHIAKKGSGYVHQSQIYGLQITGKHPEAVIARTISSRFWKRKLEKAANEDRLNNEATRGIVGGKKKNDKTPPLYCSDETLTRVKLKEERNQQTLSKYTVRDIKTNQTENLWTLAQKNTENQLNQTYWIIKSMESIGMKKKFDWLFITLTAPPIYHPNPSLGKRTYDPKVGVKGSHNYINERWVKIRSNLAYQGVAAGPDQYFGLRTVEPHKDGCIHWHLVIFINPEHTIKFSDIIKSYFKLKEQAKIVKGDSTKGTAASYIYKYIAKGLSKKDIVGQANNETTDQRREDNDLASLRNKERVQAAIRTLSARQYQIIGIPRGLITLIKEINKLDLTSQRPAPGTATETVMKEIWKNRNALIYLIENPKLIEKDAQGQAPIMLYKINEENTYGEAIRAIKGVLIDGVIHSRAHRFVVKRQ